MVTLAPVTLRPALTPHHLTRQETVERLLFQVEAAYWFYDDEYREIWPRTFPFYTLPQFSQKLFSMCELLKPFEQRTEELYDRFRQYKIQIPTCGAMLINPSATKVLLVLGYKSKSWGFPKGKIDRDEEHAACAVREVTNQPRGGTCKTSPNCHSPPRCSNSASCCIVVLDPVGLG